MPMKRPLTSSISNSGKINFRRKFPENSRSKRARSVPELPKSRRMLSLCKQPSQMLITTRHLNRSTLFKPLPLKVTSSEQSNQIRTLSACHQT